MRPARCLAFALAALTAVAAHAQQRAIPIPDGAKRAQMRHVHDMLVEIDGKRELLAAGAQIRDAANRLVVPTSVPQATPVRYMRDGQGRVHQVWILSPKEAAAR